MAATAPDSTAVLLDLLRRSNILPAERLKVLPAPDALPADPAKAAAALVQQGFVTKFQATQLLAGRHKGFRIGQYVIQEQIGRGGMGSVYRAEHLELSRKVALKVLAPGKGEDQKLALERFLREARSAAALDHPNIVKIFDVSRHNETPYLVMEYVDGDTLQQCVDRAGPLAFEAAAECIAQAAAGLQHAHEKGVIHRDIKPANLIRDRFGAVKILDMGLARSGSERDKLTEVLDEGAVVGTADYISPEQAINCPTVDARADIYSLGATLFTLLVGKTPFEGNTTQKLMQHQLRVAPPIRELNPEVPEELADVVAKMLQKKAADRYQSAAEVVAALAPWAAASARVLAGLSQTSLGATASHTSLGQTAASSRRLLSAVRRDSDASLDPSEGGKATGVLSSQDTLRDPKPKPEPAEVAADPAPAARNYTPLVAALTAALVAAVAVAAWLVLGRDKPAEGPVAAAPNPDPQAPPQLKPVPKPNPAPRPNPEPPKPAPPAKPVVTEEVVWRFDPAKVDAFRVRLKGGLVVDGKRGALPAGVAPYALKDGEAEFAAGPVDGAAAVSIARHAAVGDTHVAFELERDAAGGGIGLKLRPNADYKLRLKCRSEGAAQLAASVHTLTYKGGAYKTFPAGGWATVELPFTRGAEPVRATLAAVGPVGSSLALGAVELVEVRGEKNRLSADLRAVRPFVVRSGLTPDPSDAAKKNYLPVSRSGEGDLPAGWQARVWNTASEMEAFADAGAVGVRNVRGPGAAMLFTPRFDAPSGVVRAVIEYAADGRANCLVLKFKPDDARGAFEVLKPAVGGTGWRTAEHLFDLRGASGGYFEFHYTETNPGTALRVRAVTVVEPNPVSPDREVFALDADALPDFANAKLGRTKSAGADDPKVAGVNMSGWKPETRSEWTCGPVGGARAIGFTNLSDVLSAEIGVELEGAVGLKFAPGQHVRARVTYRTAGKGRGTAFFQHADDKKVTDRAPLPTSNAEWRTVELVTTRGASPLRLLVAAAEKGAGNTLFVRSVVVSEVGGPRGPAGVAAAPAVDPARDPAAWSEGATLYALDVAAIPPFRTQKEKGGKPGDEQLPAGVGFQCWKDGAVGDFRRAVVGEVPALGVTNLNGEQSGQYVFSLEGALKLHLEPGKGYRVKVGYRTDNDATGTATVHVLPGFRGVTAAKLAGASEWRVATASFVRPPAEDKVELRLVIDNTSVGEGNTLWIRSVEVVELTPPKK